MFVDMEDNELSEAVALAASRRERLPRRRPLPGMPGINYRPRADGEIRPPWEFRYLDAAGRGRWQVVHGTLAEAEALRARLRSERRRRRAGPTYEQFALEWLGRQMLAPRTIETYAWALRRHLLPAFGHMQLDEIGVDDVARFIADLRRDGLKGWTVSGILRPLSISLNHARRREMIAVNPVGLLARGERPSHEDERPKRILDLEEMKALIAATERERHRCLFELLIATGLRIGEALGLAIGDLDCDRSFIRVECQLDRHGTRVRLKTPSSRRSIDIPERLLGRLVALVEERDQVGNRQALVFASSNETGLTRVTVRNALRRAARAAGLRMPYPTLHDLRHSHASMLIGLGCNVSDVQHRLGHRSPVTTLHVYTHQWGAAEAHERAIARKLESLFC